MIRGMAVATIALSKAERNKQSISPAIITETFFIERLSVCMIFIFQFGHKSSEAFINKIVQSCYNF
jgi:hypothetical protein